MLPSSRYRLAHVEGRFSATDATRGILFLTNGLTVARNFPWSSAPARTLGLTGPKIIPAFEIFGLLKIFSLLLENGQTLQSSSLTRLPRLPIAALECSRSEIP